MQINALNLYLYLQLAFESVQPWLMLYTLPLGDSDKMPARLKATFCWIVIEYVEMHKCGFLCSSRLYVNCTLMGSQLVIG